MYLGNPLLPLNISLADAEEIIRKEIRKKDWVDFNLKESKLLLVPYFYFNHHFFKEDDDKKVKASIDGFLAMNGSTLKLEENVAKLINDNKTNSQKNIPKIKFSQVETNIEKKELLPVIKFKLSEYFQVPKQNIVVSSIKKFFLPIYEISFLINNQEYFFNVGAVEGNIFNSDEIPFREKKILEIIRETLRELSKPNNWLKYFKEIFLELKKLFFSKKEKDFIKKDSKKNTKFFPIFLNFFSSKFFLLILMLLALFLIFISLFY